MESILENFVSRRDLIRWAVSSLILAPVSAAPGPSAIARWSNATVADQCDLLFREHLPSGARKVASQAASNFYAAIFGAEVLEEARIPVTRRWLCLACETSPGQFAVQTSDSVLAESTSFDPVDVSVSVLDVGEVEVFQQGLRWNITERWRRQGDIWQLSKSASAGVSGGMLYQEEYDQLRQELVMSCGRIEDERSLSTERQAISTIFALGEYTRGSLA
jgi:hypothetical protein